MMMPILISILLLLGSNWGDAGGQNRSETTPRFGNPFGVRKPVREQKIWDSEVEAAKLWRRNNNSPYVSFCMAYCREFRFIQNNKIRVMSPRLGYAEEHYDPDRDLYRWTWSVLTEKVEAEKYAGGSLAVVVLDERGNARPQMAPLAGVLVTDPDLANKYAALIPGHYRWGDHVTQKTTVYLPSPSVPEYWCRVWASGSRVTVHQGQNYTVVQTLENFFPNEPTQPAVLLPPNQRTSFIIPSVKCTTFGFPEGNTDLRRVDVKVVECGEAEIPDSISTGISQEGSYFCTELRQDLNEDFKEGVGWRWDTGVGWEVPRERMWPVYCQNWTDGQNSVYSVEADGEGPSVLLAGFMRNLKVVEGRAFARAQYI